jgi:uroporphyrinogen decarboxylase
MLRRDFLVSAASAAILRGATPTHKERVDKALAGTAQDRPPFSFWHHFGLKTPEAHAQATLSFHAQYKTDLVKVMSDFPYPKPAGPWYELRVNENPFEPQIRALALIRDGLGGQAYFVETLFNSWNVAEKLSSPQSVLKLKQENPKALLNALDVITQSQIHHARKALAAGAAGVFLSVANAQTGTLSPEDYSKFSAPFDKRILEAASGAKLNVLHIHGKTPRLELFRGFPAAVFNYSVHQTDVPVAVLRKQTPAVIAAGIDEDRYPTLTAADLDKQWKSAAAQAGAKFLLTPGCSVPNSTRPEELQRLPGLLKA